jgi:hypothetical protein
VVGRVAADEQKLAARQLLREAVPARELDSSVAAARRLRPALFHPQVAHREVGEAVGGAHPVARVREVVEPELAVAVRVLELDDVGGHPVARVELAAERGVEQRPLEAVEQLPSEQPRHRLLVVAFGDGFDGGRSRHVLHPFGPFGEVGLRVLELARTG